jgi:hypothetical protein
MNVSRKVEFSRMRERALIGAEIMRRGFGSARAYADANPGRSLEQLVTALELEAVHDGHLHLLLWLLWEEAVTTRTTEYCARDLLARDLFCHPGGGGRGSPTAPAQASSLCGRMHCRCIYSCGRRP